ncbi:MAG: tetratricopeptide repeat protein [Deltaproteobacteria bacterium]|nr:tetratricopeptide repeat protein [Deltaproteobacteria bacterium]
MTVRLDPQMPSVVLKALQPIVQIEPDLPSKMDGSGPGGSKDSVVTVTEVFHYIYNTPNWQRFLPLMDQCGLHHPLDTRRLPPEIVQRAQTLLAAAESTFALPPNDPAYCDMVVPYYFHHNLPPFDAGGLGLGYPDSNMRLEHWEMTAAEAYAAVLDPTKLSGACTEATYMFIAGSRAAGLACPLDAVLTQSHIFPRSGETPLDPSKLGKIGWEYVAASDAEIAAVYYSNLASSYRDGKQPATARVYAGLSYTIAPRIGAAILANVSSDPGQAFAYAKEAVVRSPEDIAHYLVVAGHLANHSRPEAQREALSLLADAVTPGAQAYALFAVQQLCLRERNCDDYAQVVQQEMPQRGFGEMLQVFSADVQKSPARRNQLILEAIVNNPNNAVAWLYQAMEAMEHWDLATAKRAVALSVALAPNLPYSHSLLSQLASMQGKVDLAYDEARKEALVMQGNPEGDVAVASAALAAGKFSTARAWAEAYAKALPHDHSGALLLGSIAREQGDGQRAIHYFARALKLMQRTGDAGNLFDAVRAEIHTNLASLHTTRAEPAKAAPHIRQVHQLAPESATHLWLATFLKYYENDIDGQLALAERLVTTYSQLPGAWTNLAFAHYQQGDYRTAQMELERALASNPNDIHAHLTEIYLRIGEGATDAARLLLVAFRKRFGQWAAYEPGVALQSLVLGDEATAHTLAAKVLANNPREYHALAVQGLLTYRTNAKQAQRIAKKMQKLYPKMPIGYLLAAKSALAAGDLVAALREVEQASTRSPYDTGQPALLSPEVLRKEIATAIATRERQ